MIPGFMLDTNAASALIKGRAGASLLKLAAQSEVCLSVITEAELRFGVARKPEATRLARAVAVFLHETPILPWTSHTALTYAELRARMESQGLSLSSLDLLIAAHALATGCTLVTADQAFTRIPGLPTLNWLAE